MVEVLDILITVKPVKFAACWSWPVFHELPNRATYLHMGNPLYLDQCLKHYAVGSLTSLIWPLSCNDNWVHKTSWTAVCLPVKPLSVLPVYNVQWTVTFLIPNFQEGSSDPARIMQLVNALLYLSTCKHPLPIYFAIRSGVLPSPPVKEDMIPYEFPFLWSHCYRYCSKCIGKFNGMSAYFQKIA
jgi:hypothetical protein